MNHATRVDINELDEEYTDAGVLLLTLHGQPFTGIAYELGPTGKVWSEQCYEDGVLGGVSKEWYPSGQLRTYTEYKWNRVHGKAQEWYENGQLKLSQVSELGSVLYEKQWDAQGNLLKSYDIKADEWSLKHLESQRELFRQQGIFYQLVA